MHLGHALSALLTYEAAKEVGGEFLLRIEDIDIGRTRESHITGIKADLTWLGISWPEPVLRQSTRFDAYKSAAAKLDDMRLLYPCFATRKEIQAAADPALTDPDGAPLYPGLHKHLTAFEIAARRAEGQPFALRLDMARALRQAQTKLTSVESKSARFQPQSLDFEEMAPDGVISRIEAHPERWGDAVIVRKDVPTSYHLAVVVDDTYQSVTNVTRGRDLYAATDLHRLLQLLLDLPAPVYSHHRLITDQAGRKLAKTAGDQSLTALRDAGRSPTDIRHLIGL